MSYTRRAGKASQHKNSSPERQWIHQAKYCSLHVRVSNEAAIALYGGVLGYEKNSVAEKYYADGEDAFDMVLYFDKTCRQHVKRNTKNK